MRSGGSQEGLVCPISEGLYIYIYIYIYIYMLKVRN